MDVEKTIRDYLPRVVHMSLATSKNNKPWVCEVHFAYDEDLNLYFRSLLTRRHSLEIAENPNVAGNIVTQHELDQKVRAVYFEGNAKVLEVGVELDRAYKAISERMKVGEEVLEEASKDDGHHFYKITVDKFYVFDSRESNPSQKYELAWNKDS